MNLYLFLYLILVLVILGGMIRIIKGPNDEDRMLAGQFLGTVLVAVILLQTQVKQNYQLLDIALVFSVLAAVASITFVSKR